MKLQSRRFSLLRKKIAESVISALIFFLVALETEIAAVESHAVNVDRFLSVVRHYTEIEELTPAIVHEFIDRIIDHEPEQA